MPWGGPIRGQPRHMPAHRANAMNVMEKPENWLNLFAMVLVLYVAIWIFSQILIVRDTNGVTSNGN